MGYIVDISEHNTITDWAAAKKAVDLMIVRIGYRGSINDAEHRANYGRITEDKKAKEHLAAVKKYRIPYTVYFFTTAIVDVEAVEEAAWIRSRITGLQLVGPVFIDTENVLSNRSARADRLNRNDRTHLLRVLTDHLIADGIPCGIYSYRTWLTGNVDMTKMDPRVIANTWVADAAKTLGYRGEACLWQYGKQRFPWAAGDIDVNKKLKPFTMEADKMEYYRSVIVAKAASYMGTATGSAKHKEIVDTYNKYTSSHGGPWRSYRVTYSDAWCATFTSAIAILCGYQAIIPIECGCPQLIEQAKSKGIWKESDAYIPKAGDLILYDWNDSGKGDNTGVPKHVGYVRTVSGGYIYVIEGNGGNAGKVIERKIEVDGKYIRGFITPKYTAAAPAANKPKTVALNLTALPELHLGDRNDAVKVWQALIGHEVTGVFDESTQAATKAWQKKNGKTVDGWVGKGCWTKMAQIHGWM